VIVLDADVLGRNRTGEETYVLKVVTRNTEHLDEFLARAKAIPGMIRTKTTIVLSTPFERGGIALDHQGAAPRRLRSVVAGRS